MRPHEICHDTLVNDRTELGEKCDAEEGQDEGRAIKDQRFSTSLRSKSGTITCAPTYVLENGARTVGGKCVSGAHRRNQESDEEIEKEVPVTSVDYMRPKSRDDESAKTDSLPILLGVDRSQSEYSLTWSPTKVSTLTRSR